MKILAFLLLLTAPALAAPRELRWDAPPAAEVSIVAGFRIYRQLGPGWTVLGESPATVLRFSLGNLVPGETYVYAYSKFNADGDESERSDAVTWVEPPILTKPPPPRIGLEISPDNQTWRTVFEGPAPEDWNRLFLRGVIKPAP